MRVYEVSGEAHISVETEPLPGTFWNEVRLETILKISQVLLISD